VCKFETIGRNDLARREVRRTVSRASGAEPEGGSVLGELIYRHKAEVTYVSPRCDGEDIPQPICSGHNDVSERVALLLQSLPHDRQVPQRLLEQRRLSSLTTCRVSSAQTQCKSSSLQAARSVMGLSD
jgi:hypothetical protein